MNLQTHIKQELWAAVSNTYEAANYSHAILDAIHFLSNVLREKTGADGDGSILVGQALGGESPRLRLNKLQTDTERNIQRGIEQILRGMYLAIRNPRSHEQIDDEQETADTIIYFVNYIIGIIAQSEEPFTVANFMTRVLDPDFMESDHYADLLAGEIPINKRIDTLIEIYRQKLNGDWKKLKYIIRSILKQLSDEQVGQFVSVISDELKVTQDENTIRSCLQILPPEIWPKVSEVARLRIENKLIQIIKLGEIDQNYRTKGALGTWARDYLIHFTLKQQAGQILLEKLEGDIFSKRYATKFFIKVLPDVILNENQRERSIKAITSAIRHNYTEIQDQLINYIGEYPEEWQHGFVENLQDLTNPDKPKIYLPDGTPFLSQPDEDDIPF